MSNAVDEIFDRMDTMDAVEASRFVLPEIYQKHFVGLPDTTQADLLDKSCRLIHSRIIDQTNILADEEATERQKLTAFRVRVNLMRTLRQARVWYNWFMTK